MHKKGRERKIHGRGAVNKTMVLAALQRGGGVRLKVEKVADRETLHGFIKKNTRPETKFIYTDELPAYKGIEDEDTKHESVNHGAGEYVRGDVHTNGAEGVFSLFKRSIVSAYHQISAKHLDRYLDEFEFRLANRDNPFLSRDALLRLLASSNLEYKELTAKVS